VEKKENQLLKKRKISMDNYLQKVYIIEKYFRNTKYDDLVNQTLEFYNKNNYVGLDEILSKFPTEEQLFEELIKKLEGKSVFKTLKSITEDKGDKIEEAKGISSLITHTLIEIEENKEYRILLPILLERLNQLLYGL